MGWNLLLRQDTLNTLNTKLDIMQLSKQLGDPEKNYLKERIHIFILRQRFA